MTEIESTVTIHYRVLTSQIPKKEPFISTLSDKWGRTTITNKLSRDKELSLWKRKRFLTIRMNPSNLDTAITNTLNWLYKDQHLELALQGLSTTIHRHKTPHPYYHHNLPRLQWKPEHIQEHVQGGHPRPRTSTSTDDRRHAKINAPQQTLLLPDTTMNSSGCILAHSMDINSLTATKIKKGMPDMLD